MGAPGSRFLRTWDPPGRGQLSAAFETMTEIAFEKGFFSGIQTGLTQFLP